MKRIYNILAALILTLATQAQTLNVVIDGVTYQFPANQVGEMNYASGTTLSIMEKDFALSDITKMYIDTTVVSNNYVNIIYDGSSANVFIAGNIAPYVNATINGAHINISQTNTADIDGEEITYSLIG